MATSMLESYDSAFLGILQHEGNLPNFLDVVFGFLYRRTDYYRIMKTKEDKLGFPPGVALKLTVKAFQKYADQAEKDEELRSQLQNLETLKGEQNANTAQTKSKAESERKPTKKTEKSPAPEKEEKPTEVQPSSSYQDTNNENSTPSKSSSIQPSETSSSGDTAQKGSASKRKAEDDDNVDPELAAAQKTYQENPESFNGAVRDSYSWSQSISDSDVRINIPKYVKRGKDVKVTIERKRIKAQYKDESGEWQVVVDNELCWDIYKEESMWSLVPGEHIHVNLEKVQERWWESVFVDEPKLSVRKMECSRPMTDLDDEAQAKIEQMMYDDHRKKLGLPTSEQQKMNDMLKKAWDAEGSPFKGQPFDPSKVNLQTNNTGAFPMNPP